MNTINPDNGLTMRLSLPFWNYFQRMKSFCEVKETRFLLENGSFLIYFRISSRTSQKQRTIVSMSSRVCAALTCVRIRAFPFGTTG